MVTSSSRLVSSVAVSSEPVSSDPVSSELVSPMSGGGGFVILWSIQPIVKGRRRPVIRRKEDLLRLICCLKYHLDVYC